MKETLKLQSKRLTASPAPTTRSCSIPLPAEEARSPDPHPRNLRALRGQRETRTPTPRPGPSLAASALPPGKHRAALGVGGDSGAGGPSALFTWSQTRGQAGRVRERIGHAGACACPPRPGRDSEAASGVFAGGPLAARKYRGPTEDGVAGETAVP